MTTLLSFKRLQTSTNLDIEAVGVRKVCQTMINSTAEKWCFLSAKIYVQMSTLFFILLVWILFWLGCTFWKIKFNLTIYFSLDNIAATCEVHSITLLNLSLEWLKPRSKVVQLPAKLPWVRGQECIWLDFIALLDCVLRFINGNLYLRVAILSEFGQWDQIIRVCLPIKLPKFAFRPVAQKYIWQYICASGPFVHWNYRMSWLKFEAFHVSTHIIL